MLDRCGITRDAEGLRDAIGEIARDPRGVLARPAGRRRRRGELNQSLEYAGRVADFLELAELMCRDALERDESCGCHLREEHQTEEGEAGPRRRALRPRRGLGAHGRRRRAARCTTRTLDFEVVEPVARSYK